MATPTNSVRFNAAGYGTADFVVASAPTGYVVPESANVADGKTYRYYAQSPDGTQWQAGFAPYFVSTHTLAQSLGTISATSNGDQLPVNFILAPIVDVYASPATLLETTSILIKPLVDLNTITTGGTYYCITSNNTNGPTVGGQWYIEVIQDGVVGSGFLMQRATNLVGADATTWVRVQISGTWQAWTALVGTGVQSLTSPQKLQAISNLGLPPQCGRLLYVNTTAISFVPYNGDLIKINGAIYRIPVAGIAGTNTGVFVNGVASSSLIAGTLYYAYLFVNGGVVTFDFSTTGHATSSTAGNEGVEIKSGDDTRTLVGMIYAAASGVFAQTQSLMGVLSWFNRQSMSITDLTSNVSTSTATTINISATPAFFLLNWAGDACDVRMIGAVGTTGAWCQFGVGIDGAFGGTAALVALAAVNYTTNTNPAAVTVGGWNTPTEGLHAYWVALGAIPGGTASVLNISYVAMVRG